MSLIKDKMLNKKARIKKHGLVVTPSHLKSLVIELQGRCQTKIIHKREKLENRDKSRSMPRTRK